MVCLTSKFSPRTYVTFAGKLRLVGTAAVLQDTLTSKSFGNFLPLLGRKVNDVPEDQWKYFNKKMITLNEDGRIKIKMEFNNMGWEITPEQLLAMQLIKLKQNSRMHSDIPDIPVGICVPCYLTDPERRAVLDAAKVADLRNVTLINHVDALCSYYMVYNKKLPERNKPVKSVAFVSMGYTGTEVAICGFQKGVVEILSIEYDANLGGRDFDQAIFEELIVKFEKANDVKIDRHSKRAERIRRECANLKVKLSANKVSLPIRVDGLGSGKVLQAQMSREELEVCMSSQNSRVFPQKLCDKLVLRFRGVLERCLCSSKLKTVDVIELVGGSSRIPILKEMIYKVFSKRPQSTLNAEEVIARGCAIQAS
ncbi:heat shock protein 110kDa [Paragonimus westermani]|uniref:Heat shock protein 110kDa n=1 Tax=Paragonimus westermani TaxID=34504 RepID=A0A5J4NVD1_9TREM|nr:heat shock protein 110kDa [Paragonimus westermani]